MKKSKFNFRTTVVLYLMSISLQGIGQSCPLSVTHTLSSAGQATFVCNVPGAITYTSQWWLGNGVATGIIPGNQAVAQYTSNGLYTVTVQVQATLGGTTTTTCTAATIYTLSVNTLTCSLTSSFSTSQGNNGLVSFNNLTTGTGPGITHLWKFGDGQISYVPSPNHTYNKNGNYNVKLISSLPGCIDSTTVALSVNNVTCAASFSYSTVGSLQRQFVSMSVPGVPTGSLTWYFPGATPATSTNSTVIVTFPNSGVYNVLLVNSGASCSVSANQSVTVNTGTCALSPKFSWTVNPNGQVLFTNNSTGTTSTTSYQWKFGNYQISTSVSPTHNYGANGNYTVTLSAWNGSLACLDSVRHVIQVNNVVCGLSAGFGTTSLGNGSVYFTNLTTNTVSATTYTWHFGDGSTSNQVSPVHNYTANGSYTTTLVASNNTLNCQSMFSLVHSINTISCVVSFSAVSNPTLGQVMFNAYSAPAQPTGTLTWSFPGSVGNHTAGVWAFANYPATGIYTVSIFLNGPPNCATVFTQNIFVSVPPCTITAGFSATPLSNGQYSFVNTSTGTNTNTLFHWDFGDGQSSQAQQPLHTYSTNGQYLVSMTLTDTLPYCSKQHTLMLNVNNMPCQLNAGLTYSTAPGGLVNFYNATTGTVVSTTYTIDFGDGSSATSSVFPFSHTYSVNGTYTVVLTANNNVSPACVSTSTLLLSVSVATCTSAFSFTPAPGGVMNFQSVVSPMTPSAQMIWNFGNGSTYTVQGNTSATATYTANGIYTVTLTVLHGPCVSSVTQTIQITNAIAPCAAVADFSVTYLSGGVVQFHNLSSGGGPGAWYSWYFGDGDSASSVSPVHTYTANGFYTVTLTINGPCYADTSKVVVVSIYPCLATAAIAHTVQAGGVVTFSNNSGLNTSTSQYFWNFGDGSTGTGIAPTHTYQNGGTHYVYHIVSDTIAGFSCKDSVYQAINITGTGCNANANFTLTPSGVPQHWNVIPAYPWNVSGALWSWGDGSTSATMFSSHTYSAPGNYNICLTVYANCGDSATACSTYSVYRTSREMAYVNVIAPVTGITESAKSDGAGSLKLYPNPGCGIFYIEMDINAEVRGLFVCDARGQVVHRSAMNDFNGLAPIELSLQDLPDGLYVLCVETIKGPVTKKFVVSR